MEYACLQQNSYALLPYEIEPLRERDILAIKHWRNEQISLLRQLAPLTDEEQHRYYQTVILPSSQEKHPSQILFSLLCNRQCIGYGGIVHIDWAALRGEVSFLVATPRSLDANQYRRDFSHFLRLLKKVAFDALHLHRLFSETYDIRPIHIEILESEGFVYEGRNERARSD